MKRRLSVEGHFASLLFVACSLAHAQLPIYPSVIPQIVDGGAWLTTIVLTNTGSTQAVVSLSFYQETGGGATRPWNLNFEEMSSAQLQNLSLPAGSTLFLHTLGQAAATSVGWAELSPGRGSFEAYVIFTQRVPGRTDQSGTAEAAIATAFGILVPFDDTNGGVTAVAIANSQFSPSTVSVSLRTGSSTSEAPSITLPGMGHTSFRFIDQFPTTANQSGLAQFYSDANGLSILALRFNNGAFTSAPVYAEVAGPPPILPSSLLTGFDGTYTCSYNGSGGTSGTLAVSLSNGTVTVTSPVNGTGTVYPGGYMTFDVSLAPGTTCAFSGNVVLTGATATASGMFSCPTTAGNWNGSRQ